MKELELLQQKLEHLLKRYAALQATATRLETAHARQVGIIREQALQISSLQKTLQLKSVAASATHSESEKEQFKQHLDQVIIEIEKNLELL